MNISKDSENQENFFFYSCLLSLVLARNFVVDRC